MMAKTTSLTMVSGMHRPATGEVGVGQLEYALAFKGAPKWLFKGSTKADLVEETKILGKL